MKRSKSYIAAALLFPVLLSPVTVSGLFQDGPEIGGVPWPSGTTSQPATTPIKVCFRSPGTKPTDPNPGLTLPSGKYTHAEWIRKRAMVRDALESSWQKWTGIRFESWAECPGKLDGYMYVDLIKEDCGGCGNASPRGGYHATGVNIWLKMENPDERLLRTVIIHEFGHALGFHHEMDRPDAKFSNGGAKCNDGPVEYAQGNYLTPYYDDVSVMNYCAPRNRNGLSAGDIAGAQRLYDASTEDKWMKALPSLSLYAM